jgi:selenocysteine lyase/cysteine desulfurase
MTKDGDFDYEYLERILLQYKQYNGMKIGAFSAGSNITGTLIDVDRISVMLHKAGALAIFDYAAVCPYVDINVNGKTNFHGVFPPVSEPDLAYKDAIFLSPHKLVGGPGTSGVLLAKKNVLFSRKPHRLGGGIVFFVDEIDHEFVSNIQELEESGTPGIIQDIRAGLVFQLKEAVSVDTIM